MNLANEFQPIRDWALEKGILAKGDAKTQCLKLLEEAGELAKGIINGNNDEIRDAIGDCTVVLVSLASLTKNKFEDCVNEAYGVIKNRTGKMIEGTFVKHDHT